MGLELEELERAFPPSIELVSWNGEVLKYKLTSHAPTKLEWSLTFGDCLHNYRSSLDALYFGVIKSLADRHQIAIDEEMETSIQFPICIKAKDFKNAKGLKTYGTDVFKEDLLLYQPFTHYKNMELRKAQPLEQLRLLSNKDRHRQLNIVQTFLSDYTLFHEAGLEVTSGRRITYRDKPNEYLFEFNVKNGKASDRIEFIPRFTTGVIPIEGTLPHNSVQNLLGLISGQIFDYIEKLEFHIENDLGKLLNNLGKN